jgi:hypothetical protein
MLPSLPGWRRRPAIAAVLFEPPDGPSAGWLRYREHIAPLRRFADLRQEVLSTDPEWQPGSAAEREWLLTTEGEHASFQILDGTLNGTPARRFVAAVFGDDFANVVDCVAGEARHFALFERICRALVPEIVLRLGIRRRRFRFTPPPGWQGVPSGLVATFYPPGFPSDLSNLTVYPANPVGENPDGVLAALLSEEEQAGTVVLLRHAPTPVQSAFGLTGQHFQLVSKRPGDERPLHRDLIVLQRHPYLYSLVLDSFSAERMAAHRQTLLDLARSAEPVPLPGERRHPSPALSLIDGGNTGLFTHWL